MLCNQIRKALRGEHTSARGKATIIIIIRQFVRRPNMSVESLQGRSGHAPNLELGNEDFQYTNYIYLVQHALRHAVKHLIWLPLNYAYLQTIFENFQRADRRLCDPQGASSSLYWLETGMADPQEELLAVHCICV